jgi:23S rRNA pseudouridine1911/1915/1917 synthase
MRADRLVADLLKIGRNEANGLIKSGAVFFDGVAVRKPSVIVEAGGRLSVAPIRKAADQRRKQVDFNVDILYEDDDLLVINKPRGIVVHGALSVKSATLVDWLKAKGIALSNISGEDRMGIVHRIDKETTGALLIAKSNDAHRALSRQLEKREMGRYYIAAIDRRLKNDVIVDKPIARHRTIRVKMTTAKIGREAKSAFIRLADLSGGRSLIACKLFSGRTHQIRTHLQSIGAHIIGDSLYGYNSSSAGGVLPIFLHAYLLYFRHPKSGEATRVKAPLTAHFEELLNELGEKKDEILEVERIERGFNVLCGLHNAAEGAGGT